MDDARLILDRLTNDHELLPFDPDDPEATQVLAVEHGGRTLEVLVPLLYDDTRVGEVVTSAVSGETVFLLCRHDRPLDDSLGTLGLLVVAVPHREGRYRAVIAHATYALERGTDEREGLGLYPPARPGEGRPTGVDAIRALEQARPFRPFVIETTAGERYSVPRPGSIAISPGGDAMILWSGPGRFTSIDPDDIGEVTRDDPEAITPAPSTEAAVEDHEGLQEHHGELRFKIGGVEADIRRGDLGLERKIQQGDPDLRREIRRVDFDLRHEFQRGHHGQAMELASLKCWSDAHGWILRAMTLALSVGFFPTVAWIFTISSDVQEHDRRLKRIQVDSAERDRSIDVRLDELRAAIRQASDRSPPPR
jgi:hypothetical protein